MCALTLLRGAAPFRLIPQIGDTLEEFLLEATPDPKLRQLMMSMSEAIRTIAYKVRRTTCCSAG